MKNYFTVSAAVSLIILTGVFAISGSLNNKTDDQGNLNKFDSEEEFREYVSSDGSQYYDNLNARPQFQAAESSDSTSGGSGDTSVRRSSKTNIQVSGVSEPDILKNAGEKIYYSPEEASYGYWSQSSNKNTSVFRSLPAENFSETAQIPETGRMFLTSNSVISLGETITSYDRENYEQNWELNLNSSSIVSARKINSSIYLVLRKDIRSSEPCPVRPMSSVSLPCTEFYRPSSAEGGQTTYTLVKVNAENGKVQESTGFVGSGSNTVVYVSKDSIYLTYYTEKSETEVLMKFLEKKGSELFDSETVDRIEEIRGYDISDEAKRIEIRNAIQNYRNSLSKNKSEKFNERFENKWSNYTSNRKRELSTTGIAEFNLELELESEGSVPGKVNDQFSLSEKGENFRIATTVGSSWRFDAKSANDLYVLGDNLEIEGKIQGLGLTERIYSVRYINNKAYVVTFRRVDPFHVIDLSDPSNPQLKGKLKLPGFSSYLHPLSDDRILGIGEEDGNVKAVIFDVSGDKPKIQDSKVLDDWYSDISDSHHAFKIDRKHKVFFLPGSQGGHIFSYSEGLKQVKEVNMTDVKRATYVNDYLYVFSDNNATVIDETNWKTVKRVQFAENEKYRFQEPIIDNPRVVR